MKKNVIFLVLLCATIIILSGSVSAADVPSSSFTSNVTNGDAPLSVQFNDTSAGNPTSWYWNFDDGSNSTDQNPTHTYTKSGNYSVSLKVTNDAGNDTNTKNNYIKVNPTAPVPNFYTNQTLCFAPLTVDFNDLSTGEIISYAWDFDDNGTIDSTEKNPTWIYTVPGIYTVVLTVTGPGGSNTLKMDDYIKVPDASPPVPKASIKSGSYNSNLSVKLSAKDDKDTNPIIYYTLDGTNPTRNVVAGSTRYLYTGAITISKEGSTILKFIAIDSTGNTSQVYSEKYVIDKIAPKTSVSLKSGLYNINKKVAITMSEKGIIYYTLNGSTPTKTSSKYTGAINITNSCKLKFFAMDLAGNKSPVYTMNYTIDKVTPKLISTSFQNNSIISLTSTFWFKLSEKILTSTNWSKIYVKNLKTGAKVAVNKTVKNNILYLQTSIRSANTWYQVYIPGFAVKDLAGNNLTNGYIYKFKTGKK